MATKKTSDADQPPPEPARQLTPEARAELNALLAAGTPMTEALAKVRQRADAFRDAVAVEKKGPVPTGRELATTREDVDTHLEALATRLDSIGLVPHAEAVPVTPAQLKRLEARADLPYAYSAFMKRFGGARCRLFSSNHHAVEYEHLLRMQTKAHALAKTLKQPLPDGALAIMGHLGEWYCWFHGGGIDQPVHILHEGEPESNRVWWHSILGWIDMLATEAEGAWNDGYFKTFPNGTSA